MLARSLALLLLLGGCDDVQPLRWRIVVPGDIELRRATIEARVLAGGCGATTTVWEGTYPRGAPDLDAPIRAEKRVTYGLSARAIGPDCIVLASRCVEVLPRDRDRVHRVVLDPLLGGEDSCPTGSCVDGLCTGSTDAGPEDAGPDDASAPCDPDGPISCSEGELVRCEAGGLVTEPCPLGCASDRIACLRVVPSNVGPDLGFDATLRDVEVSGTWYVHTDDGCISTVAPTLAMPDPPCDVREPMERDFGIRYVRLPSPGGTNPELGVFRMGSLHVPEAASIVAVSAPWDPAATSAPNRPALVLLVAGSVRIDGTLTAAANATGEEGPGPGGFAGSPPNDMGDGDGDAGDGPGAGGGGRQGSGDDAGGGGGGHATRGGSGGAGDTSGGNGGSNYGGTTGSLTGGSGGGSGGDPAGAGGHGGGAVQVSSNTSITIGSNAMVSACGSGGAGGGSGPSGGGGSGGGAGGAILLEAPVVTIEGQLAANGGGGGQGAPSAAVAGAAGTDGSAMVVPAPGGAGAEPGGDGGAGSDLDGNATQGEGEESGIDREGGGGGGGAGRIRIHRANGLPEPACDRCSPSSSSLLTFGRVSTR